MPESQNGAGTSQRQLAMVFNLDKCIGCQGCTVSCRTHWKVDREGADHLYNIWCETKPGEGWPKGWMDMGRQKPDWVKDYGGSWEFNLAEVYNSPAGEKYLHPTVAETGENVSYGPVWEEDKGGGEWPNGYFFYMPRMCNQCTDAPCLTACADFCGNRNAPPQLTRRESDGIITIDPEGCFDCGVCVASCPYKIPMENIATQAYEMCDFCVSRVDRGYAPVCAKSCPARAMYFGYLDDQESYVSKLVNEYKVALPLRPDFGTKPNVFYIPPFVRPNKLGPDHEILPEKDLPVEVLRQYFGPDVDQALATLNEHREAAGNGEESELMDMLIIYDWADAFKPFDVIAPLEPIQVEAVDGR
jgi:nitrate reductase beta subunit